LVPELPAEETLAIGAVVGIAVVTGCGLAARFRSLAGTTLRGPWWWAVLSLGSVAAAEVLTAQLAEQGDAWVSHLRYAAAVTTFCPLMALLGAKRPQDRAWPLIVLSLWVILALPAGQAIVHRPDMALRLHAAWRWFLLILIAVGLINALPTRYWPSALLTAAGQALLLRPNLPVVSSDPFLPVPWVWRLEPIAGLLLLSAAAVLWAMGVPRAAPAARPLDRVWIDFRDAFGVVWALRVADRFNDTARICRWPARLGWHGLAPESEPGPELDDEMRRALATLLRRFVSPEWIQQRMPSAGSRPSDD
jgi:hypothetical protein